MTAADDPVSTTVTALWKELLGVEVIGLNDNFFDLGGHSLLLAQLRDEITERTGVRLSMAELYANPTLNTQIQRLSQPADSASSTVESDISARVARQRAAMLRRRAPEGRKP